MDLDEEFESINTQLTKLGAGLLKLSERPVDEDLKPTAAAEAIIVIAEVLADTMSALQRAFVEIEALRQRENPTSSSS